MTEADELLALYYYPTCGFCRRVMRVIDRLDIDVDMRNIWEGRQHRVDLMAARGRTTVPVLRIQSAHEERWMGESADIIAFLESRYG